MEIGDHLRGWSLSFPGSAAQTRWQNMGKRHIAIVGGGAAGFFAAITAAETLPDCVVTIYEATAHLLAKVKVSGGGRCNVTHACFEARELVRRYPRGGRELLGAFSRWQPRDTVEWFEARGDSRPRTTAGCFR